MTGGVGVLSTVRTEFPRRCEQLALGTRQRRHPHCLACQGDRRGNLDGLCRVEREESDLAQAKVCTLEDAVGIGHERAVLEAKVGMGLLRRDVGEVRTVPRDRQVVADQPPAGSQSLDGIWRCAAHDRPKLMHDRDDRRREELEERGDLVAFLHDATPVAHYSSGGMSRGRLEAFSDGVLAIVITIMVLELRPPEGALLEDLFALWPKFLAYVMSFVYIGIYWNNHHHLLHATHAVTGRVLWANLHLLFWLSIVPFATAWMGETHFEPIPVALYAGSLIMPAVAFSFLVLSITRVPGQPPALAEALGRDLKGKVSIVAYAIAMPVALFFPFASVAICIGVALLWIVPDPRFERSAAA